jgi:hypothetical protein
VRGVLGGLPADGGVQELLRCALRMLAVSR